MDKELLARKLYVERVSELMGEHQIDETILEEMWENKASPTDAVKAMLGEPDHCFAASPWLQRYLDRR